MSVGGIMVQLIVNGILESCVAIHEPYTCVRYMLCCCCMLLMLIRIYATGKVGLSQKATAESFSCLKQILK